MIEHTGSLLRLLVLAATASVVFSSCSSPPRYHPGDVSGPVAKLSARHGDGTSPGSACFQYTSIDGYKPARSLRSPACTESKRHNDRYLRIPADRPVTIGIKGVDKAWSSEGADLMTTIGELVEPVSSRQCKTITGNVTFTPREGRTYVVTGRLDTEHSSIWIEDEDTGHAVTERIPN